MTEGWILLEVCIIIRSDGEEEEEEVRRVLVFSVCIISYVLRQLM